MVISYTDPASNELLIRVENPSELYGILSQAHSAGYLWDSGHLLMEHTPDGIPMFFGLHGHIVIRLKYTRRVVWFPVEDTEELEYPIIN